MEKGMVINLNLDWRIGIAAKDWDSLAKKEKVEVSTSDSNVSKTRALSDLVIQTFFLSGYTFFNLPDFIRFP